MIIPTCYDSYVVAITLKRFSSNSSVDDSSRIIISNGCGIYAKNQQSKVW